MKLSSQEVATIKRLSLSKRLKAGGKRMWTQQAIANYLGRSQQCVCEYQHRLGLRPSAPKRKVRRAR